MNDFPLPRMTVNTLDDVYRAFALDPYAGSQSVQHETIEQAPAVPGSELTGLVRVHMRNRYAGLVERRGGRVDEQRGNRASRGTPIVLPAFNDDALEPLDPFAMQSGTAAYTDSLLVADEFFIAWRLTLPPRARNIAIERLPLYVFLHGVPSNMDQLQPVHRRVAQFAPVLRFDMLGMGHSDKPRFFGRNSRTHVSQLRAILRSGTDDEQLQNAMRSIGVQQELSAETLVPQRAWDSAWDWQNDASYIAEVVSAISGMAVLGEADSVATDGDDGKPANGRLVIFVADDWGAGPLLHYLQQFEQLLPRSAIALLGPASFDGYPVHELQAIGRESYTVDDAEFMRNMRNADSLLAQLFRSMVHNPAVLNQYSMRALIGPYGAQQYISVPAGARDESGAPRSVPASAGTMQLNYHALRVLCDRIAAISTRSLLPSRIEGEGIDYQQLTVPLLVMWGEYDSIMPELQRYRFALWRGPLQHMRVARAGHYAGNDQPNDVAARLLDWTLEYFGRSVFGRPFFGFDGVRKGDEQILDAILTRAMAADLLKYETPRVEPQSPIRVASLSAAAAAPAARGVRAARGREQSEQERGGGGRRTPSGKPYRSVFSQRAKRNDNDEEDSSISQD